MQFLIFVVVVVCHLYWFLRRLQAVLASKFFVKGSRSIDINVSLSIKHFASICDKCIDTIKNTSLRLNLDFQIGGAEPLYISAPEFRGKSFSPPNLKSGLNVHNSINNCCSTNTRPESHTVGKWRFRS